MIPIAASSSKTGADGPAYYRSLRLSSDIDRNSSRSPTDTLGVDPSTMRHRPPCLRAPDRIGWSSRHGPRAVSANHRYLAGSLRIVRMVSRRDDDPSAYVAPSGSGLDAHWRIAAPARSQPSGRCRVGDGNSQAVQHHSKCVEAPVDELAGTRIRRLVELDLLDVSLHPLLEYRVIHLGLGVGA